MFQTGRPIVTGPVSGGHAVAVTSTAASVGPYRLFRPAGRTAWNRSRRCADSASPLQMTSRSVVQSRAAGSRTKSWSIEGTKCAIVTPVRRISSARYAGSRWPSGLATTRVAPEMSGRNSSHTETSKPSGVFCRIRSSAVTA
ncbi:hypothetical protein Airi02_030090 [Actinoallomurus iriomotensis]|uniref:Uncharacterized protein n=1 Tax=Actinoallomurus iriomotensis TaxID=478107 RepID=A0A9W6RZH9_9ACTN|nr:hypothetical protein Airi02_030090 [Actinoallomurus iriomotensis]